MSAPNWTPVSEAKRERPLWRWSEWIFSHRPWALWAGSLLIALFMSAPLLDLLIQGIGVAPETWSRLLETRLPQLFLNTMTLAGFVTLGAVSLGFLLAWLVERTDLPGRSFFKPMLLSPLIVPCYVVAICYVEFFGKNGLLEKIFAALGANINIGGIYGLGGAAFVLILATYPFVYVIARSAIRQLDPNLIDAARCSGASRLKILRQIALPLLLPALSAGVLLSVLYALSDFGVVTKLRYDTFVKAIYQQMTGSYNPAGAMALGSVLVVITLICLWLQGRIWSGRRRFAPEKLSGRVKEPLHLGIWKVPALTLTGLVLALGLLLPVGILGYWWIDSWGHPQSLAANWAETGLGLLKNLWNSLSISALAAILAVVLALPLAYALVRRHDRISRLSSWLAQAGQALPGVLIALGVLTIILDLSPFIYATFFAILFAYLVRFFSQALQALRVGLSQIPARLEEGARLLGEGPLKAFIRVTLPLLRPALLGGWVLVFLSTLRELPATLLLRPVGFDTLPIEIWTAAGEGFYAGAAPAALLLVAVSIPLLIFLHSERRSHRESLSSYE